MKRVMKVLFFVAVLAFFIPHGVHAEDYIADAVEALKTSTVYVAPGTAGTDYDTAAKLQSMLRSDDNIVLVMLPMEVGSGTDINTIVRTISDGLGNQRTIGLAVGRDVIGYGPLLPAGVAADQMQRADSVSNDPVTALITFSRNMHSWLDAHPQPKPTATPKPTPTPRPTMAPIVLPKAKDVTWPVWAILFVILSGTAALIAIQAKKAAERNKILEAHRRRMDSFKPIQATLNEFQDKLFEVQDSRVRGELEKALLVAQGLLEILQRSKSPQGYMEEKFPTSVKNMFDLTKSYIGHESGKFPLPDENLRQVRQILMNYDDYFAKLQQGNQEAVELMAAVINQQNAYIDTLGYLPKDK